MTQTNLIYGTPRPRVLLATVAIGFPLFPGPAFSQDPSVFGDQPFIEEPISNEFSFSYGIDFTTNYISKGFTQTDDKPAVQVYAELSYGLFYVETFASNADFGSTDVEVDIGGGFRPTIGNLELNIGYAQYLYFNDSTDYGEAFVHASYPVLDQFSVGMKYWHEVFADFDTLYLEAEVSDLPWGLSLSGGFGSDFGTRGLGVDADFGDIGLSKDLGKNASIDVRGHYSRIEKNRLIGTLSFFY